MLGFDKLVHVSHRRVRRGAPTSSADRAGYRRRSDRSDLPMSAWRKRDLKPRDYLFEGVLSTTSRWMISGDTGIGKTLFTLQLGTAGAAGANFLNWKTVRPWHACPVTASTSRTTARR